ncbi:MAG: endonuclease MutS2 [Ignavibacteria bacterium]|nr:endonuclease MutS2 [Ignavibacteria bacterium]
MDTNIYTLLEFEKILSRIKSYIYSGLGMELCENISFISDRDTLEHELLKTSEMKDIINREEYLQLDGLQDVRKTLSRLNIEGNYISSGEFLSLLTFLRISRIVKSYFAKINTGGEYDYELIPKITSSLFVDRILENNIDSTIDETGSVRETASAELKRIRITIRKKTENLRKSLEKILKEISDKDYSQDDIITQRDGRFVVPVKVENKRKVPGLIHSSSNTGQTVFIEPAATIELNNDITELQYEEKREIERILAELGKKVRLHLDELKGNCKILAEIDFLQAKARYAIEIIAEKPALSESEYEIKSGYHPVLLQTHKREEVVPLNFKIGGEYNSVIISGPNAGGKTVSLKTIGLLALMLQCGILVPAQYDSKFKILKNIFVSIGDQQSLENDLSTFSSHIAYLKKILDEADDKSLILIDEICSGTDPVLGSALSCAVIQNFSDKNSFSVVTTHNSELKAFAYNHEKIENASLEFNNETLSPNFKFNIGIPGQSFTFEIAGKYNFPAEVVSTAKSYLNESENKLEDLLKELNENKQKFSELKHEYDREVTRLKGLNSLYETKVSQLKANEKEVMRKAKEDAKDILQNANKLIENTIREIREKQNFSAKEIKEEFQAQVKSITKIEDEKPIEEELTDAEKKDFRVGDFVKVTGTNSSGELMEIKDGSASININGLLIKAKLTEIEKTKKAEVKKEHSKTSTIEVNEGPIERALDLRGKYAEEIYELIDKFLHNSSVNGLKSVEIIHGKGTGKLRNEVQKYLKSNPNVRSYRLGNWNEGDTGVTIVEL